MASDSVSDKSGFLCMYMSGHPDTLVAYAKYYGKVSGNLKSAEMTSISTKTMNLKCTFANGSIEGVNISIEPPLKGYDDVKPRLLEMKSIAQEALGMIKTPQVDSFTLPGQSIVSAIPLLFLMYTMTPIYYPHAEPTWFFSLTNDILRPFFGDGTLKGITYTAGFIHVLEGIYALHLARKHTSFGVGFSYVLGSLVFGFPVLRGLRRKIQQARIDSVMKVE